ncbi:MAG: undecaprenyl-diphosphatase [Limisphaerales bacterium]|jgi:undecaprenyl-diphosphatase
MTVIEAIILGIIQGLTEFLPVSSSGHIQLGNALLGTETTDSLSFTIIVHAATVLSTMVVFRSDIANILSGLFKGEKEDLTFAAKIIASMVPTGIIYIAFKPQIEALFDQNLTLVGICLLVTAAVLGLTTIAPSGSKKIGWPQAILIGISQAIAILPGISRSGSTISTALYMGIDKEKATRFSFLMVIPLILGGSLIDIKDMMESPEPSGLSFGVLAAGFIAAFIAGLAACHWMIGIVKKGKLTWFAIYCAIVGIIAIIAA